MIRNRQIRLQNRAFIGVWAISLGLMLFSTSRAWLATTATLTLVFGISYWWARQLGAGIEVERKRRYGWARVGDVLEERFQLRNSGPVPALWLEIDDRSTLPGHRASMVTAIGGGENRRWTLEGVCQQRGVFEIGPWSVHMSDPFGLFDVTLHYPEVDTFTVYPPVAHLPDIMLPRGDAAGAALRHERAYADTTVSAGVRSYAPGDALRRVHWPTTARRRELYVKQFDLEPAGDLWILLDLDTAVQAGVDPESTIEVGITIAASLTHAALTENRAVGLGVSGASPALLGPQKGRDQLWRVLQALARAQPSPDADLAELVRRVRTNIARGLTLAVITPACTPDWPVELLAVRRRGVAVAAILLDPVSFGGSAAAAALRSLLADLDITCHIIERGLPLPRVFDVESQGRPEFRVSALGRAATGNGRR